MTAERIVTANRTRESSGPTPIRSASATLRAQVLVADRPSARRGRGVEIRAEGVGGPPSSAGTRRSQPAPTNNTNGYSRATRAAPTGTGAELLVPV